MHVLAIDTSTLITSVAVVADGDHGLHLVAASGGAPGKVDSHSNTLVQLVDTALHDAGLPLAAMDGLAIGAGPGSFTGLRIGMATAKGLAFAAGKPLWAVSSLAALALDVDRVATLDARTLVVPLLDARRQEVYAGFYRLSDRTQGQPPGQAQGGTAELLDEERVISPADLAALLPEVAARHGCQRILVVGDGLTAYSHILDNALRGIAEPVPEAAQTPSAVAVARLAMRTNPPDITATGAPVYIRPSEAEIKFPQGNPGGSFSPQA